VIAENILDKYAKVWTLVDSDAPESPAARNIMEGMEQKYPGIRQQAEALRAAMNPQYTRHDPTPTPRPQNGHGQNGDPHNPSDWRKMAANAFSFASQYAYQAFGAMESENIAQRVRIEGRDNPTGTMSVTARFDQHISHYARLLTPMQKEMIAGMVADRVKHEILIRLTQK
tara:strand:+ start:324 stop:836 length:513 start_codon:yes stop_codon:yes gene_type:complete